jgi:hypothetical protein
MHSLEGGEVLPRFGQDALWIENQLAGDGVAEPEAAILVTSQTLRARSQGIDIGAPDPSMGSGRDKREITALAKVHDVLPGRVEDLSYFAGGQEFVTIDLED